MEAAAVQRKPGRRFEVYEVRTAAVAERVEIRYVCGRDGNHKFTARVAGEPIADTDIMRLRAAVRRAVERAVVIKWGFCIEVEHGGDRHFGAQTVKLGCDLRLVGVGPDGSNVSAPCHMGDDGSPHVGHADRDGCCTEKTADPAKAEREDSRKWFIGAGHVLVPFTRERWEALKAIERALEALSLKLADVLHDDPVVAAANIDRLTASGGLPLLGGGVPEKEE